jgi:hypothetical protein
MESTIPDYQMQEEAAVTSPDEISFLEEIERGWEEGHREKRLGLGWGGCARKRELRSGGIRETGETSASVGGS